MKPDNKKHVATTVGKNIRYWRKQRGMTARKLSADVGLAQDRITDIEMGHTCTTVYRLALIAEKLSVPVSALVMGV